MIKSKIVILVLLLFCVTITNAQTETKPREKLLTEAKKHINDLKQGVLLIKVPTGRNKLAAMSLRASTEQIKEYKKELKEENDSLFLMFNKHYNFSKHLFFYDTDMNKVLKGDYENTFINSTGEKIKVDSVLNSKTPVYILETERIYFETQNSSSTGFVVQDKNLNYLKDPFPYYIMRFGSFDVLRKPFSIMVIRLNEKLETFYTEYGTRY